MSILWQSCRTMSKVIAIHQPNFFPWLGYFDKIARSDLFIFLDDVQYQKTGGTWSNRVKLLLSGEPHWATAPIERKFHGVRNVNEIYFKESDPWRVKLLRSLELNYRRHPFFVETMHVIEPLILEPRSNLAEFNSNAIISIAKQFGIQKERFLWSSKLQKTGRSNALLTALTLAVGGQVYMCGGGADGYQDEQVFVDSGLVLKQQSFVHPVYPQQGNSTFQPGLSIIDPLMNIGIQGTRTLLGVAA